MKCPNCGKTIKKTDKFCQYCGMKMKDLLALEEEKIEEDEELDEDNNDEEIDIKEEIKKVKAEGKKAYASMKKELKESTGADLDEIEKKVKKGIGAFSSIVGNVTKASGNYLKAASEKLVSNSESVRNGKSQEKHVEDDSNDIVKLKEKLKTLKEMLDEGLITQNEYDEKRSAIMGTSAKKKEVLKPVEEEPVKGKKSKNKVNKCPNCGEIVSMFDIKCPSCGYMITNKEFSSAIDEFKENLAAIDAKQFETYEKKGLFGTTHMENVYDEEDLNKMRADYIKKFVVPSTGEDMLEFMILAQSNIDTSIYSRIEEVKKALKWHKDDYELDAEMDELKEKKKVADAWFALMKQVFQKSKAIMKSGDDYKRIEKIYVDIYNDIT